MNTERLTSLRIENSTSEELLRETLKLKLKSGEEVTWGDVVIALSAVGDTDLAQQVAMTHCVG